MFLKLKLRRLLIKIQELKVKDLQNMKIIRKDKTRLHGLGGKLLVRIRIAFLAIIAQNQPVVAPLFPVAVIPLNLIMLYNIWVFFEINNKLILLFLNYIRYMDFDLAEILGITLKLDRFIHHIIKTYKKYIYYITRSSINKILEDPNLSYKA
jgi:hypothetical protein